MPKIEFSDEAIAAGIETARAVWNAIPTDMSAGPGIYAPLASGDGYIADAGYAYAVLDEAARIDGIKLPYYAGGPGSPVIGEPAPNLPKNVSDALSVVSDFARWAAETKPRLATRLLGF